MKCKGRWDHHSSLPPEGNPFPGTILGLPATYLSTALMVVLTGMVLPTHKRQPQTLRTTLLLLYLYFFNLKNQSASADPLISPLLTYFSCAHINRLKYRRQVYSKS